jgi:hypothetical protein
MNKEVLLRYFLQYFNQLLLEILDGKFQELRKLFFFGGGNTFLELQWLPTGVHSKHPKGAATLPVKKNMKIFSFRALELLK